MRSRALIVLSFIFVTNSFLMAQDSSPYAGQETSRIKALSSEEIEGYLKGHGMGMAKAAELNHYPGPKHVMELADRLGISKEQREQTEKNFSAMKAKVTILGAQLVEKERILDEKFVEERITKLELQQLVEEIALLQGKIRLAHLEAHLVQKNILTLHQVQQYDKLRGYHNGSPNHRHDDH